MSIEIKLETEEDLLDLELEEGAIVEDALTEADVNSETVIVEKEGEVVSVDEELGDGDWIKTVSVVSGG